ncbi:MAG: hypothetical protein Q7S23_00055 [bacterium]|nr:hypothetical protein [bacterium]
MAKKKPDASAPKSWLYQGTALISPEGSFHLTVVAREKCQVGPGDTLLCRVIDRGFIAAHVIGVGQTSSDDPYIRTVSTQGNVHMTVRFLRSAGMHQGKRVWLQSGQPGELLITLEQLGDEYLR